MSIAIFSKRKRSSSRTLPNTHSFAGQRESLTTASKQSFRSSPAIKPFSQSDNLSSIVPSLNLLPDFEQEFTKAVSVIKSNIDKNNFI